MSFRKLENYFLWCLKTLIYVIPFLPLYISSSMVFPYITGKNFAFRVIVELSAALWVVLLVTNRKYRLQNSTITLSILAFTFIVGLADVFGINPYKSLWSNYERMEGYITILHLTLYFMVVKSVLRTKKDWKIFFNIFVAVSVFVSLYALFQKFGQENVHSIYDTRVYSTVGNPPFLASYLLLSIFLGLILIFTAQKKYLKGVYLSTVVLSSIVIYFTASRGAILAGTIGMIIFSALFVVGKSNKSNVRIFKRAALFFLGIFILAFIVFLIFGNTEFIKQDSTLSRFTAMFSDPSVKTRLHAWKIAWEGIKERPILGWGQENFIGVYTVNPIPAFGKHIWLDRSHNIVIDWLINAGFLGLLSYLAILGSAFYGIWTAFHKQRIAKPEQVAIVTAFVVYFVQNLFTFDTINTYIVFFTLLAYIDNLIPPASPLINGKREEFQRKRVSYYVSVTLLAMLIFSGAVYFINYKPIRESQLSKQISALFPQYRSYLTLLDDFNKALSYNTFGNTDLRLKMNETSHHIVRFKLFTQEGALKFIQKTAEELEEGIAANRYNLEYLSTVILFYTKIGYYAPTFIAKAEALIKECMRINPDYEVLYFLLAENYVLKKEYEKAYAIVRDVVSLDPHNERKQFNLVLAAIRISREDLVSSALENLKKIRIDNNADIEAGRKSVFSVGELLSIARTYMKINNYKKALQYYKEIIAISPEEAKHHFGIAMVYLNLDDKVNAMKEAKKAAELDPLNYTEEVEKFINSIN